MTQNIYRQLQERLDLYSMGFPPTESGIELEILHYLFSEKDAQLFLALSHALEPAQTIAERIHQPLEAIADQLEQMAEKGLVFRLKKDKGNRYGAIPFVHGLFEFQVKTLTPELAGMVGDYFDQAFDQAMQKSAGHFLRVVPVNQSLDLTHTIASYEDAVEILKTKEAIVVAECICRKRTQTLGKGCGKPLEACFMFGSMGQYYVDKGMGRSITLDQAIEVLKKCRESGLVTQPATAQNPSGMCNCCGDCCGVLGAVKKHPEPATLVFSNHVAAISQEDCTGCELCLERCQMDALALNDQEAMTVAALRCIGCGLCVTVCPVEAITLMDKPSKELRIPPATMGDQMMQMAKARGII